MNAEFIAMLDYLERERGIKREILLEAVSNALLSASKKSVGASRDLRIDINRKNGEIRALANLVVVDEVANPQDEIELSRARKIKSDANVGEIVEVEVTPKNFGRIAAQTAKQAMMQRIRQAEKEMIYEEFKDRAGEIVSGTVRRFDRSDVILDLGKFEAVMPQRERVAVEDYNVGDRLRAYVVAVDNGARGPEIIVSRSHPNFVRRLFELEVSEIADGTVEIRGIAREAGYRTKIAVWSANEKVDPVGACVGMRGVRIQSIVSELARLGRHLQEEREVGHFIFAEHLFWTTCLFFFEMPPDLRVDLAPASLVIVKGDANYRRLLGDCHWLPATPFDAIVSYFPAPLAALRTLKAELIAGLRPGEAERYRIQDPAWLTNGQRGVVQFSDPAP